MSFQTRRQAVSSAAIDHHRLANASSRREIEPCFSPDLSVVIPVLNERENVIPLYDELRGALDSRFSFEIIFVDDGSSDATSAAIGECMGAGNVRLLRHRRTAGQSAAILNGVRHAHAHWVATLDGDGQNDPSDILRMWNLVSCEADPPALVMGLRKKRQDTFVKRASSRIANWVRRSALEDDCMDSGCGIKLFDRDTFLGLPAFDHMHRFMPALFNMNGHRVISTMVNHRPRRHGRSKYGVLDRLWVGIIDLFGVMWLRRRATLYVKAIEIKTDEEETS